MLKYGFMCTIITISNQKGGVAKTTSTAAIAADLAKREKRVLMIDLDSQGSLSSTFLSVIPHDTIADTLNEGSYPIVNIRQNLDIIPCNTDISAIAQEMREPADRLILRKALNKIKNKYDFIIIDCPPAFNYITCNAYTAADYVLVPCQTSKSSLEAISLVADACYSAATPTRIDGIFFTMYDPRPKINRRMEKIIRDKYPEVVFNTPIRKSVKVEEALEDHNDIINYEPNSNPAKDYISLVDEILTRIK